MCFLLMTFVPIQKLCVNIYIYVSMHTLYESYYRKCIYIQQECHSVLVKLHPITFYRTVFLGNVQFLGCMPLFVFYGLPIVSSSMINSLILGCLWPLVFVLNNILILGIWRSATSHLPGCFCPWIFFQNIGFNMVPSDPFMSCLATQFWIFCMGVSGFATDCPCSVWCHGLTTCLLHVGPHFGNRLLNNSWAVGLTQWIVYLNFFFFWNMQLYMFWYIIIIFGFIFSS